MNCGFIIKLSGNKISFLYNKADKNGLFPFDGNRPVLPLAILKEKDKLSIGEAALKAYQTGSKDAFVDVLKDAKRPGTFSLNGQEHAYGELLLLAAEEHLSAFMQQAYLLQGKTYEGLKPELPIGFLFNDCVTDADQDYVMQVFESHGYGNVSKIDFNTYLFNNFSTPHVLVVSGDGRDIALRLYDRDTKKVVKQRLQSGAGADPRVKAVAELFYNVLNPAGATKEKTMPKLEVEAAAVLDANPATYQGNVNIDGMDFEFFVMRSEVNAAATSIASSAENLGIAEFVHEAGVDMSECSMIVSPSLAANSYFRNALKSAFPEIKMIDDTTEKEVLKVIDAGMREGGFKMSVFGEADNDVVAVGPIKNQTEDGITILGNKMPKKDIKGEPHSTYIIFNVLVPKDARYVEIRRRDTKAPKSEEAVITRVLPTFDEGDEENRVLVPTEYTDSGLKELTPYRYNFVAVYFDEYGHEAHTADLELDYRTVPDVGTNEKPIQLLLTNDTDTSAILKWSVPKRAKMRLFYSESPFTQKANDVIMDEAELPGVDLNVDDAEQQYIVKKDYHGEHFFLPVTVRNGRMVAGDPVSVQSKPQPRDVKATYIKEEDVVRVEWEWGSLRNVQVIWQYPGDNRTPIEVPFSNEGRVDVAKSPAHSQVLVEVRSVFASKVDGSQVTSAPVKRTVTIPAANVDLASVKSSGQNKYTYTLSTLNGVPVPCDLRLLVKEGEADFDNPDKRFDIKREYWQQGKASKQIDFTPRDKYSDLYFRVVLANESHSDRINLVSAERTVLAPERPAKPAPKKGPVQEPTFTDGSLNTQPVQEPTFTDRPASAPTGKNNTANGGSESHTVRYIIVLLVVLVGAYFCYNKFFGGSDSDMPEVVEINYTSVSLTPSDVTLTVGETHQIVVTGEPQDANEAVTWMSQNTAVASVSADGVVTAHEVGNVDIEGTTTRTQQKLKFAVRVKAKKTKNSEPGKKTEEVENTTEVNLSGKNNNVKISEGVSIQLPPKKENPQPNTTTGNSGGNGFKLEKVSQ